MPRFIALNGYSTIFFAVLCVMSLNDCQADEKTRICGKKLVSLLNAVCKKCFLGNGVLNNYETAKRSDTAASQFFNRYNEYLWDQWLMNEEKEYQLWEDFLKSRPTRGGSSMSKRGIVDECCVKQCPYNVLKSYCANDCPHLSQTE